MLFNSIEFLLFLPTVFFLYWFVFKNQLRAQNVLLLVASYIFYGWWDWRFLSLIIASTFLDYFIAIQLGKTDVSKKRKFLLGISLAGNLGMLGFFKYYNFFVSSWIEAWSSVGITMEASTLNIILPVGISFYTFQTLSYTIDVYRKEMQPTKSFIDFAAFVTFFPQLVAGPIERASHLLPQFYKNRTFDYQNAVDGVKLIIWGMFKKVVVADNCAFFVNKIFENPEAYSSGELFVGMVFFAFQIYGDFSGYSDMAIGISKLFGFDLMVNFKFPYFSRDIAEFWRRWHISLSTWFRDYIYIPLGGSKGTQWFQIRNVMIIFLVSGFWHGANWTYVVWGLFHALMFLPLLLFNINRSHLITKSYGWLDFAKIGFTFFVVCIGWVFFRADSIADAFQYLMKLFSFDSLEINYFFKNNRYLLSSIVCLVSIALLMIIEFISVIKKRSTVKISNLIAIILVLMIFFMGSFKNQLDFIYFQF
ncbi:MAG: MBOAT family protein [Flavobacterium sp.]|nr:MBOAT family O-acyltransferase [Flavobacterium sp.]MCK6607375.1 MBOAT family protein [Flavobacterium sp.]